MDINEYPENDRNNYIVSIGIRDDDFDKLQKLEGIELKFIAHWLPILVRYAVSAQSRLN